MFTFNRNDLNETFCILQKIFQLPGTYSIRRLGLHLLLFNMNKIVLCDYVVW